MKEVQGLLSESAYALACEACQWFHDLMSAHLHAFAGQDASTCVICAAGKAVSSNLCVASHY